MTCASKLSITNVLFKFFPRRIGDNTNCVLLLALTPRCDESIKNSTRYFHEGMFLLFNVGSTFFFKVRNNCFYLYIYIYTRKRFNLKVSESP